MKSFKRILVALDLTSMDNTLIKYSFGFGRAIGAERIYFIYCARELEAIKEIPQEEDGELPHDESIQQHLSKVIEKHYQNVAFDYEIIVDQIKPLEGLLHWREAKKTDLLIVGKKKLSSGSGVVSRQFVRQSDCSVLFVPDTAKEEINNILIPIDFSDNSRFAVQMGTELQPYFNNPPIICLNVYFAAPEFYGSHEASTYTLLRKKAVAEKYAQFIAPYEKNKKINPLLIADNDFKTTAIINDTAKDKNSDLIIIGAIGHSKLKLLTVGSTAEKMMLSDLSVPLLVVR